MAEISLDGLGEFHNEFRGSPGAFDKAMQTYDGLAKLQQSDARLRIHSISTATEVNIAAKACYCTNEVFLWPSITYQPQQLVRAMIGARVWQGIKPLGGEEKVKATLDDGVPSGDHDKLMSIQACSGKV